MNPKSRLEWEHGIIKIPGSSFPSLRKTVLAAHQRQYGLVMDAIGKFWSRNRSVKDSQELLRLAERHKRRMSSQDSFYEPALDTVASDFTAIWSASIFLWEAGENRSPKPTKEFLASRDYTMSSEATNEFRTGFNTNGTITFVRSSSTVVWEVKEGDRACERERASLLGVTFFQGLGKVEWSSKSGGLILGNDEYSALNRKYIKTAIGPAGRREAESTYFPFR